MTDKNELDQNDEQVERLLKPLGTDTAPVNNDAIHAALRVATESFNNANTSTPTSTPANFRPPTNTAPHTTTANPVTVSVVQPTMTKAKPMFAITKSIAVLVTSAVMIITALVLPARKAVGNVTLGRVLDQALNAETLQLKFRGDGAESDVWIQAGRRVRWEDSAQHYSIADGSRLWRIDESKNSVVPTSNPWLRIDAAEIDLVAMLGVAPSKSATFRSATSIGQVEHAGVMCDTFQFATAVDGKEVLICAFADVETHKLYSIGAWPNVAAVKIQPPTAELRFVARNVAVDEDQFVVGRTLSEDGRIGKIGDAQGIVLLRPMTSSRWTPVAGPLIVKQGDWLRTDVRGANAAAIKLTSQFDVVLGPGSLLEFTGTHELKLHRGEVRVTGSETANGTLKLKGLNNQSVSVATNTTKHVRIDRDETLADVAKKPLWLQGFEGTTSNESIGSLIANIDGRSVPLTVGFHKVKVEIRDQIARTTIEESFVNHTDRRMEGVFHFPLPQDASISGFGMWIGGELIEADVVEKQRAREIYETILRERRDPGLLEWTGGNIFKARVFPIEPHSEKRIKIVYTQVLPVKANQYRYSYGLRSEMLQKNPLRELSLEVLVHSAIPLKSVTSPTHEVRTQSTAHSSKLEFTAQEYTPTRDFEVICEIDSQQSDVVVIPHRRGEDGYFLAQVTPPSAAGNWQREVLSDGKPLNLLLVCDTSGSMDSNNRDLQDQFVTSVLSTLGPDDRFNIAMCDVDCQWKFEGPTAADEAQTKVVRDWLAERRSLGWTDLDRMTKSVLEQLSAQDSDTASTTDGTDTHVIYIGDGIVTARDADPIAFMNRLKSMTQDLTGSSFHAVSMGSSFESGVLKSIAAVGGGSVRQIDGEQTAQRTAHELLNEIAQPGLRNLKVEFRGLKVAAVYPETLPNLSAGTQQIIIGRYLPQGDDQTGEIIVTGERNGETVRYVSRITLQDAEAGNSFIPRLWARSHLDTLLQQGTNQSVKDDIIALSEEFHIMTPYTSLLVLETDEDRERFGVKRRFLMRDGERFFADGRDNASFELLQQQMKAAGEWRLGMRRRILNELSGLGRDTQAAQQLIQIANQRMYVNGIGRMNELSQISSGMIAVSGAVSSPSSRFDGSGSISGGYSGYDNGIRIRRSKFDGRSGGFGGGGGGGFGDVSLRLAGVEFDEEASRSGGWLPGDMELEVGERKLEQQQQQFNVAREMMDFDGNVPVSGGMDLLSKMNSPKRQSADKISFSSSSRFDIKQRRISRLSASATSTRGYWGGRYQQYVDPQQYTRWVDQLIPALSLEPAKRKPVSSKWPADAQAISQQLVQPIVVNSGGLKFQFDYEAFDPRWNRQTSLTRHTQYYSPKRWLHFHESVGAQTIVQWCDENVRGVLSRTFHMGQTRDVKPRDLSAFSVKGRRFAETPLHETYPKHTVEIQRPADGRIVLLLTPENKDSKQRLRITIDAKRNVLSTFETLTDDKVTSKTTYSDYTQVAGCWWAKSVQTTNGEGKVTSTETLTLDELTTQAFDSEFKAQLPKDDLDQLIHQPILTIKEAKVAAAGGKATFADHLILLLSECQVQNWDEVFKHLKSIRTGAADKPAIDWIELSVLQAARKNEDARQLGIKLIGELLQNSPTDEFPNELVLANHVLGQLNGIVDRNEFLSLLNQLVPLFNRQPKHVLADRQLTRQKANTLSQLGRGPEALEIWRSMSTTALWDVSAPITYARLLNSSGEFEATKRWLRDHLNAEDYNDSERDQFRNVYAEILKLHNASEELVTLLAEWVALNPTAETAYKQYLAAIVATNRVAGADKQAQGWITAGKKKDKLSAVELARLNAAVSYGLGDRHQQYLYRIDWTWLKPLEETALFFLQHEHHFDVATKIVGHHRFNSTDERDRIVRVVAQKLKTATPEIDPKMRAAYIGWCLSTTELTSADWLNIAKILRTEWDAADDLKQQDLLGPGLLSIYRKHSLDELHLPFMRKQIARSAAADPLDKTRTATFVSALFQELLSRDWNADHATEALQLLTSLSGSDSKAQQLTVQVAALHRFVDSMLTSRYQSSMDQFQANDKPEELTRTEYRDKLIEFRKTARQQLAERLSEHVVKLGVEPNSAERPAGQLADWFNLERMHLDVVLNQNLPQTIDAAWTFLGRTPVVAPIAADANDANDNEDLNVDADHQRETFEYIRQSFQQRVLILVSNLAVRKSAPDGLADRVLAYINAGIEQNIGENDEVADDWKSRKLAMLVALDQPDDLELNLREWIRNDEYPAPWQLTLGRIVAEQGKIDEAIGLFETVKRTEKSLPPADLSALANWYLVKGRQQDYGNARVDVFMATEEWQVSNWLNQQRQPWYRTDVALPTELNKNVLFAFRALFKKSNQPGNYTSQLRDFYTACRDFRLLQVVPDSIVGRTPQQIYHFLGALDSNVLQELRNEATADEMMKQLVEVRETAKSPIDKRACDLLEAMIERRSSQVLNQPGPHIDAAVAALQRAFEHEWADGEIVQMAAFLDKLGRMEHASLEDERLRQLRALLKLTQTGIDENLSVAWSLAHSLHFADKGRGAERAESIAIMEVAIRDFEQAHPGGWLARVNTQTGGYLDLLKRMKKYSVAEDILQTQLKTPTNGAQQIWLRKQLNSVFIGAFDKGGRVSLSANGLYDSLLKHLLTEAKDSDKNYQTSVFGSLNLFFRIAVKNKSLKTAKNDLRTYAFTQFPQSLQADSNQYRNNINSLQQTLRDVLGAKDALEFLVARIEDYPRRLDYTYQNAWQQFGYSLARYRHEAKAAQIKDFEPRLLAIVLAQLRQDMMSQYQNHGGSSIWQHNNTYFWKEKAGDFLRVAEDVLKERPRSGRTITYAASFIYNNLGKYNRAIEVMLTAHKNELLNAGQQLKVCKWLHDRNRHQESIPILEPLVKTSPNAMQYRTMLITAYGHSDRKQQMKTLLAETDEWFHKPGLWTETHMAQLAAVCLRNNLNQECADYYAEAIDLHQRTAPNRGIGNGTLSNYYTKQAQAFAGLENTIAAVDAASAGIMAWGRNISQRSNATHWLKQVVRQSPDLDAYVQHLDSEAKANGTDSPLIRKTVGIVYAGRKEHTKALKQLQIAIEFQPNDVETQTALIAAYEALNDTDGAVNQMLAMLDFDRHNLKLYKRLAEKLSSNAIESERAATSIVEAAPSEAEHHQAFAEFREAAGRWAEAIPHWQHVARLRALEPTGLINLAEAQIHEKQWTNAQSTLAKLQKTEWPSRFSNVANQVKTMQKQIPE